MEDKLAPEPEPEPPGPRPERFVYVCVNEVQIRQKFGEVYDYLNCSAGGGGGLDSATVIETVGGPLHEYLTSGFKENGKKTTVKFQRTFDPSLVAKAQAVYSG